jgi:hypothetical protein
MYGHCKQITQELLSLVCDIEVGFKASGSSIFAKQIFISVQT